MGERILSGSVAFCGELLPRLCNVGSPFLGSGLSVTPCNRSLVLKGETKPLILEFILLLQGERILSGIVAFCGELLPRRCNVRSPFLGSGLSIIPGDRSVALTAKTTSFGRELI